MNRVATLVERSLWILGVTCLGTWGTVTFLAHSANARNAATLERLIRESRGAGSKPSDGSHPADALPEGSLLGRIDAPRVGVSTVILEGTSEPVLEQAAGHIPGTALPGEDGNVALAGHRDSFFRGLRDIAPGDTIVLTTPTESRQYVVRSRQIVEPDDTEVLAGTPGSALTLVTCFPFRYVGPAPRRFVVQAEQVGRPLPTTALDRLAIAAPVATPQPWAVHPHGPATRHLSRRAASAAVSHPPAHPPDDVQSAPPPTHKLHWWQKLFHRRPKAAAAAPPH